jgi:hypothetical protein
MIKIPKKIKIIGKEINIEFSTELGDDIWGDCNPSKGLIRIDKNEINKEQQQITLLHELFHLAFFSISEYKLGEDEDLINRLSEVFYQIIPQIAKTGK